MKFGMLHLFENPIAPAPRTAAAARVTVSPLGHNPVAALELADTYDQRVEAGAAIEARRSLR